MEIPEWYSYTTTDDGWKVEHRRTGLRWVNLFLVVCLAVWGVGCIGLVDQYARGGEGEGGEWITLGWVFAFALPWFLIVILLIRFNVDRKTLRLTNNTLIIETKLLALRWVHLVPRDTITEISYLETCRGDDDRFPDWELRIKYRVGEAFRHRAIRARLPIDHAQWLANVLGEWAGVQTVAHSRP